MGACGGWWGCVWDDDVRVLLVGGDWFSLVLALGMGQEDVRA